MNAPQAYEPVPFHLEDIGAGEAFEAYFPGEEGAYGVLSGTMGGNSFYYSRDQEVGCIGEDDLEPGLDDAMLGDYQGDFPISAQEALPYARAALAALGQADAEQAYVGKMCAYAYGGLYAKGWKFVFTHGANGLPSLYASETVTFGGDGLPLPTPMFSLGAGADIHLRGCPGGAYGERRQYDRPRGNDRRECGAVGVFTTFRRHPAASCANVLLFAGAGGAGRHRGDRHGAVRRHGHGKERPGSGPDDPGMEGIFPNHGGLPDYTQYP